MSKNVGPNKIAQEKFVDNGGSDKVNSCLPVGFLLSNDITSSTKVGKNNILRVTVSTTTYLAFSDDKAALDAATVDAALATLPCIELASGTYFIACPADWVKASANPTRKELSSL